MKIRCPKSDGHRYFMTHVMVKQLVRLDNLGQIYQADPQICQVDLSSMQITTRPGEVSPIVCTHCMATALVEKGPGE